ncbi:hypothetical protein CRG98_042200 [Punica granatum]|uniref:Uncharacterized protein n=1 Tax=Punica granatum TaxID=22663 RepID=A0A2I0I0B6_PUNGR|nr:hypothetical protein CRG98_042200 [Punica granatum]
MTYKTPLEMGGMIVSAKRLKDGVVSEEIGEVHENLVPLRAYYFNRDKNLLVYDYMSTRSFSALLPGNTDWARTPLNWDTRSSIALIALCRGGRGITLDVQLGQGRMLATSTLR